jgi:hypothetical protein
MTNPIPLFPQEITTQITLLVENKINISMTSKLFRNFLQQMYDDKKLINYNDPYFVSKYYSVNSILNITKYIPTITNHKILNYVYDKAQKIALRHDCNDIYTYLLRQNCIYNNTYCVERLSYQVPNEMCIQLFNSEPVFDNGLRSYLVAFALKHKSYDVALVLGSYEYTWVNYIRDRYETTTTVQKIGELIGEIEFIRTSGKYSFSELHMRLLEGTDDNKCITKVSAYFDKLIKNSPELLAECRNHFKTLFNLPY